MAATQLIDIALIAPNEGQIEGVKPNPRLIKDDKYAKLVKSIKDNPEMLDLRGLLVYPHQGKYVSIGGNMRLKACEELGYKQVPCIVIPQEATAEQLNAYIIKDNIGYGQWDWDMLANEWDSSFLSDWGLDIWHPDDTNIDDFFNEMSDVEDKSKLEKITIEIPVDYAKDDVISAVKEVLLPDFPSCKVK